MIVWDYFHQKEAECRNYSLAPDGPFNEMCMEEAGSEGKRGRIFGNFSLSDRAYLSVHEAIVVEGEHVHRESYGYFLVIDGAEVWGYERDLRHDPAEHAHGQDHERLPAGRVTFKEVVEVAWQTSADWEEEHPLEAD